MKKTIWGSIAVILVAGLVGCAHKGTSKTVTKEGLTVKKEVGPTVVVATPKVKISKKAEVVIMGTGFQPGEEVHILFTSMVDGVTAIIDYALKPKPVANDIGAWVTTWKVGRHLRRNIKQGASTIEVTDSKFNFLAHVPVAFYAAKKPKKK
jgi:hypothetical protein